MSARVVTLALLAAAIASSLLAFNFLRSDAPPARRETLVPAPSPGERTEAASQGEPAEAESHPPQTRSSLAQPQPPVPPAPMAKAPEDARKEPPASDPAEMERAFATEAVDPAWAPGMEATIYEQIGELAGRDLVTVRTECRTTVCRLQVTQRVPVQAGRSADESPAMYEMWESLFARLGFESRSVTSTADANGIVTSVVYLPRGDSD